VSRARFECKLMQASTAYRMTVYSHRAERADRDGVQSAGKVRLSPPWSAYFVSTWKYSGYVCSDLYQIAGGWNLS
jgi:hypothetical protein